jgi:hypothetical protein
VATETYQAGIDVKFEGFNSDTKEVTIVIQCSGSAERILMYETEEIAVRAADPRSEDQSMKTWTFHPLFQEFVNLPVKTLEKVCSAKGDRVRGKDLAKTFENVPALVAGTRTCYRLFTKLISRWLEQEKGMTAEDAELHARAASQGILGQAVTRELVCSATINMWHAWASYFRGPGIDAEIKAIFARVTEVLDDLP